LLDRGIEKKGLVEYCARAGIAILSYFTMEQGLLTGTMSPERSFKDGDMRKTNALFSPESIRRVNAIVAELRPFADTYKATIAQVLIALTAQQTGITHLLIGARDATQAKENARGGHLQLASDDVRAMQTIADKLAAIREQK
jgi:aryl-alcohol dehydrogenase-like predicted oxidoreductase